MNRRNDFEPIAETNMEFAGRFVKGSLRFLAAVYDKCVGQRLSENENILLGLSSAGTALGFSIYGTNPAVPIAASTFALAIGIYLCYRINNPKQLKY